MYYINHPGSEDTSNIDCEDDEIFCMDKNECVKRNVMDPCKHGKEHYY